MEQLLVNKTILIAGAGGLLGSQLVAAVLAQGANVIAADLKVKAMRESFVKNGVDIEDSSLTLTELDITSERSVEALFTQFEHIDGAVNTTYPRNRTYGAHFYDVTLESFNENLSLHLGSAFLFTQQCASYFNTYQREFSLVNISSIYGVIAPKFSIYDNTSMTMPVEYAAIKSAIQHLNKYVVAYVNDSRFRINSVSPGGIFDNQPETFLEAYKEKTHGSGMLNARDVLGAVMFLLSEQSRYITGQNMVIDDGFSL
ncbi:flagellin modification protein A [Vibrio panuliri]|uniref:Flagellin modification protein A n=1 Tax=Vibrio panuliri TaxID=1381081 RepID=A0A1Q9HAJ8_9VIBR|nr:oxidoreductase [Vibrio panuliri]OLQ86154.1 flagellin modification protein A [Vibrio panuliri]